MAKFADSLEVVPRALAENAGRDVTEALSALYAAHAGGGAGGGGRADWVHARSHGG